MEIEIETTLGELIEKGGENFRCTKPNCPGLQPTIRLKKDGEKGWEKDQEGSVVTCYECHFSGRFSQPVTITVDE